MHVIKIDFQKTKEGTQESHQKQKRASNKHRRPLEFRETKCILLSPKTRLHQKASKNWQKVKVEDIKISTLN